MVRLTVRVLRDLNTSPSNWTFFGKPSAIKAVPSLLPALILKLSIPDIYSFETLWFFEYLRFFLHPSLSVVPSDPSVKGSCVKTSGPLAAAAAPHPQAPLPENSASLPGLLRPTTAENTSHAICLVLTIQLGGPTFSLLKHYSINRKYNLKPISSSVSFVW